MADDVEAKVEANADATEITVTFKSKKSMSTLDLCGELEFLAHELERANDQVNKPGILRH